MLALKHVQETISKNRSINMSTQAKIEEKTS